MQEACEEVLEACEEAVCWICLGASPPAAFCSNSSGGGLEESASALVRPCLCPRPVHSCCLARWQLHCAGREEELQCRFCKRTLPHWRDTLRPRGASGAGGASTAAAGGDASTAAPAAAAELVRPVMSIQFGGATYWLNVATGPGGVEAFKADVRRLLQLSPEDQFDITFECQVPGDGSRLELHGLEAYDAAVYCAALTAAERMERSSAADTGAAGAATTPQAPVAAAPAAAAALQQAAGGSTGGIAAAPADAASEQQLCIDAHQAAQARRQHEQQQHVGSLDDFIYGARHGHRHEQQHSSASSSAGSDATNSDAGTFGSGSSSSSLAGSHRQLDAAGSPHTPPRRARARPGQPASAAEAPARPGSSRGSSRRSSSEAGGAGGGAGVKGVMSWLLSTMQTTLRWGAPAAGAEQPSP